MPEKYLFLFVKAIQQLQILKPFNAANFHPCLKNQIEWKSSFSHEKIHKNRLLIQTYSPQNIYDKYNYKLENLYSFRF